MTKTEKKSLLLLVFNVFLILLAAFFVRDFIKNSPNILIGIGEACFTIMFYIYVSVMMTRYLRK